MPFRLAVREVQSRENLETAYLAVKAQVGNSGVD
jgi:hypothetical protein